MATLNVIYKIAADISGLEQNVAKGVATMGRMETMAGTLGRVFAGAFTVGAVVSFGKELINTADHLTKLSDKTGIGGEALQRLEAAGRDAGNTLDELTGAISLMQNRLVGGNQSTVSALERLGLNLHQLRAMKPEDQFAEIAAKLRDIKDPAEQVNVAMAVFGRTGASVLPTIKSEFEKVASAASVMGDQTRKTLDDAGDAWDRLVARMKVAAANVAAMGIESAQFLGKAGSMNLRPDDVGLGIGALPNVASPNLHTKNPLPTVDVQELERAYNKLNGTAAEQAVRIQKEREEREKADAAYKRFTESVKDATIATFWNTSATERLQLVIPQVIDHTQAFENQLKGLTANGLIPVSKALAGWSEISIALPAQFESVATSGKSFGDMFKSVMSDFGKNFSPKGLLGNLMEGGLLGIFGPSGIVSNLVNQGISKLTQLAFEGLKKIGGFFKDIFGGPSADELAGRKVVDAFEDSITSMLTEAQRMEAGTDEWRQVVVYLRDAYLAVGRTEQDALAAADRLWASSRSGADAARRAVEDIRRTLDGVTDSAQEAGDAMQRIGTPGLQVPDTSGPERFHNGIARILPFVTAHRGLAADEVMAKLQTGESVLNRRATAQLGNDAIRSLNNGAGLGGGTQTIVVQTVLDGRIVAETVTTHQERAFRARHKVRAA